MPTLKLEDFRAFLTGGALYMGRILIFGKEGQVARALRQLLPSQGMEVTAIGRPDIDLLAPQSAADAVLEFAPTLVILPAAYTGVDRAEDDAATARVINAVAPGIVAKAASDIGAPILYFSTDYVFDGSQAKQQSREPIPGM
jgi:dTDP-4-dehydrorhamnose reductase